MATHGERELANGQHGSVEEQLGGVLGNDRTAVVIRPQGDPASLMIASRVAVGRHLQPVRYAGSSSASWRAIALLPVLNTCSALFVTRPNLGNIVMHEKNLHSSTPILFLTAPDSVSLLI
jgi:hypothetical protein